MVPEYSDMEFTVKGTDCAEGGKLLPNMLLSYFQETADKGAGDCGFDRTVINALNASWIILRIKVHIDDLPRWRERFTVRTWSTGCNKFFFDREFELYDQDMRRIAYASSIWILADINTHRPLIPARIEGLPEIRAQRDFYVFGAVVPKYKMPCKDAFTGAPTIIKYADYSDIDHNHHVNNTRYLAWATDAFDKCGTDLNDISDLTVYFESEVKKGEKIELYCISEDEKIYVYGYSDDDRGVFATVMNLS